MAITLAINGFGRIGRSILRQVMTTPGHEDLKIVAINDIAPIETLAYLLRYDSAFGPYPGDIRINGRDLVIDGCPVRVTRTPALGQLDFSGVDVLIESTGKVDKRDHALQGLGTGAAHMLVSGPCDGADVTCVLGANEEQMGDARIVSNASCTTNALAPVLKALHERFDVLHGHMTTVHVYTGSQPLVDAPRGETLARSRAAAVSMVPTTTSAMRLIDLVVPQVAGRVTGAAVRVPALSVSAVDLTVTLARPPMDMVAALRRIAEDSPVMATLDDPCVSSDLRGRRESLVIALPETRISGPQARIFGWYDNEWGFSARMIDMARRMAVRA